MYIKTNEIHGEVLYQVDPEEDKAYLESLKNAWIITRTGKKVTPLSPDPEQFDILDIAWALSGEGRFANHCKKHYSVAQHCCLLASYALEKDNDNVGIVSSTPYDLLMHDATEAYMKDLPYLVKPFFPNYQQKEIDLMNILNLHFKFRMTDIVHHLDRRIAVAEIKQLMPSVLEFENLVHEPLDIEIVPWSRRTSFVYFINLYKRLAPDDAPKVNQEKYQEILNSF